MSNVLDSKDYYDPISVLYRGGLLENNILDKEEDIDFTYDTEVLSNEERRIWDKNKNGLKEIDNLLKNFKLVLKNSKNTEKLLNEITGIAIRLFTNGTKSILGSWHKKDQILYETRILFLCYTKFSKNKIVISNRNKILQTIEDNSRGINSIDFNSGNINILISGFDPFTLSGGLPTNKSGFLALALHNTKLKKEGSLINLQSVIWPVRYAEFDDNYIDDFYRKWIDKVDAIITFSLDSNTDTDIYIERFAANFRIGAKDNNDISMKAREIFLSGSKSMKPHYYTQIILTMWKQTIRVLSKCI